MKKLLIALCFVLLSCNDEPKMERRKDTNADMTLYTVIVDGQEVGTVYGVAVLGPKTTWGSDIVCVSIRGRHIPNSINWEDAGVLR